MPLWVNKTGVLKIMKGIRQGSLISSLAFFLYPLTLLMVTGAAYGMTIAPGLTWSNGGTDGGDLITAAAVRGIAHPGGYPTYLAIARLFQPIPLRNLAFRTNLLSAICMVLAVLVLFITCRHLFKGSPFADLSAWASALLFGLSPLVWSQAVITEVYALQALFTVVILYLVFASPRYPGSDFLTGLVTGLALGNHLTSLFLLLLLIWDGTSICPDLKRRLPIRILGVLCGSMVYLLLPYWASFKPPVNWGNPVTLEAFFALVTGKIYQSNFTISYSIDRLRGLAGLFLEQFGVPGLATGLFFLLGGWSNLKKTIPLVWIFLVHCILAVFYGSFDSYVYLIPAVMVFSIWIGAGIQEITRSITVRWKNAWITVLLVLCAAFGYQIIHTAPNVDASKDQRAEIFGRTIMETLPTDAIIITEDDESTFVLWYFHYALKMRGDISIVVKGLLPYNWYRETLRHTSPDLSLTQMEKRETLESIIEMNPNRPLCDIVDRHSLKILCSNLKK